MTDHPISPRSIDHIVLRVTDLDVMMAFYIDIIGCRRERDVSEVGLYQLRAGDALIDMVTVDGKLGSKGGAAPGAEGRNLDHFCLIIDNFDASAIRKHLADHGVEASEPADRYGATGTGMSIYLGDPEGNTIELKAG